jgi:capsular exopolysaccharide synthesis family protein
VELRRYGSLLKRWIWLLILITVIIAGIVFIINILTVPVYQSSTTLLINQAPTSSTSQSYDTLLTAQQLAKTYKELLRKRPVLDKVIENLGLKATEEELAKRVTVDLVRDTQLMVLSVEDTDPNRAILIANQIAKEFNLQNRATQSERYSATKESLQTELNKLQDAITKTQASLDALKTPSNPDQVAEQSRLQTSLNEFHNSYATLLKSFEEVRLAEAQSTSDVIVAEAATAARKIRPNTIPNTILAGIAGLFLAIGVAFLIEYLDDSIKTTEQVETVEGLSTLGIISKVKVSTNADRLITLSNTSSPVAEAYRILRANIEFSEVDNSIRTLVITSGQSGEGKSTTAANLAIAMAQNGRRVILVDTDLRRPAIHQYFQRSNVKGVTSLLLDQSGSAQDYLTPTDLPNLSLMASGPLPPNPAELLGSRRMLELIEELKLLADIIIFDSSPVLPVVDATLLARACDATIIVVNSGFTRLGVLKKTYNQLLQSGTRLLGVVLNRVSSSHSTYYFYYYYTYGVNSKPQNLLKKFWLFRANKKRQHHKRLLPVQNSLGHSSTAADSSYTPASSRITVLNPVNNDTLSKAVIAEERSSGQGKDSFSKNGHGNLNPIISSVITDADNVSFSKVELNVENTDSVIGVLEIFNNSVFVKTVELHNKSVVLGRIPFLYEEDPSLSWKHILLESEKYREVNSSLFKATNGEPRYSLLLSIIEDTKVSRLHLEIGQAEDGQVLVCDLDSLNGTWLNGRRLGKRTTALKDGDLLQLSSDTTVVYRQAK